MNTYKKVLRQHSHYGYYTYESLPTESQRVILEAKIKDAIRNIDANDLIKQIDRDFEEEHYKNADAILWGRHSIFKNDLCEGIQDRHYLKSLRKI